MAVQPRIQKTGQLGDVALAQAHHIDRSEPEPIVEHLLAGKRQLGVGADAHQTPRRGEHALAQEAADVVAAREPGRQRWHAESSILDEQVHQARDVGAFPGSDERVNELACP